MFPVLICWAYDYDEWIKFCLNQQKTTTKELFLRQQQQQNKRENNNNKNAEQSEENYIAETFKTERALGKYHVSVECTCKSKTISALSTDVSFRKQRIRADRKIQGVLSRNTGGRGAEGGGGGGGRVVERAISYKI